MPEKIGKNAVVAIGAGAFWGCEALVQTNIPAGVEVIKENTFAECGSLETLVIPSSVKAIERRAFFGCATLTAIVEKGSYAGKYCKQNGIKFSC